MIAYPEHVLIELRKRVDTRGAAAGFILLGIVVTACGVLSVFLVKAAPSFDAGEVLVTTGLPAALASTIIGAVCGVGDGKAGGDRDALTAGLTRTSVYAARASACAVLIVGLVIMSVLVAACCVVVAVLGGGHLGSLSVGQQLGQVVALSFSAAGMGFGIGASVRSLALALVAVVLLVLVVDVTLAILGAWSEYVRFGTLQSGLVGEAALMPTVTSGLLWVVVPIAVGWLRARTAEV